MSVKSPGQCKSCPPKSPLGERPLLSLEEATEMEALFKTLANDTRLRLLHALVRAEELPVGELAETLEMTAQAVSNQLQKLADQGVLAPRRQGLYIYYRIVDPCVTALLERGLCLIEDARGRVR